jgi:two-component system CheB/CheR fusion protein
MRIVGLGASAGGLEALMQFLSAVPAGSGCCHVVVQHLAPSHPTLLPELLQRATSMPVFEATDGMALLPDAVFVIPPDVELKVAHGHVRLCRPRQVKGMRLAIDVMLSSLAQDQGELAIGVVLSGMGSDGTGGLQDIKSQGGLTLAQQPDTAIFSAMPESAIAAGCVDIVASPADMPARILEVLALPPTVAPDMAMGSDDEVLRRILDQLRDHCRHDLTQYKVSTLQRRIARRVAVHGLASMAAYARFLAHNPEEMDLLFAEMLIGVTGFFRDPELWATLQDEVLPELLATRALAGGAGLLPLRAWVVGCSTGEEAYGLAMVFQELLEALPGPPGFALQIFATDLNGDAIAVARKGVYPAKSLEGVSPQRMARFFVPHHGGAQVDDRIRDKVLFTQHDVILDPPFTRLDLLSCRNVLIYFNADLQQRLMPLFHYSLRPQGVLVLGGSETVGRAQVLFSPLNLKARVYQRKEQSLAKGAVDFPVNRYTALPYSHQEPTRSMTSSTPQPINLQSLADQVLLQTYSPPAVLVNPAGDILYVSGRTGKYLEPAAGKANWNIHVMARPGIRTQLAVALRQAMQAHAPVELRDLPLEADTRHSLHVTVQAVREPKALDGMLMIVFREVLLPSGSRARKKPLSGSMDAAVSAELARSREETEALRLEMRVSKEALQAANEALQSINEELQSANEELTTSKEESQSMNEELQTINGELQTRLDDLALAQSDMQNLLNSTDIATLFLDKDLNVRRFTEQATRIFHLRDSDIGRPLTDLASTLSYPDLAADVKATLRTLTPSEKEVQSSDGHWYVVRTMPYRTLSNLIQGAVLTFVDVTVAKELESRLRKG